MKRKFQIIAAWLIAISILVGIAATTMSYVYSQRYVQDSNTTATQGIFMKTTLNLEQYKNVSSGNGWLGNFDRYSRSDRHGDVLTVYCKNFCKK